MVTTLMLNKYVLCFVSMAIIYLYCYKLSKKENKKKKVLV